MIFDRRTSFSCSPSPVRPTPPGFKIRCTSSAKSFNRGLNSIYFALATLGWLIGAEGLILSTLLTAGVLLRREFASQSRAVMLEDMRKMMQAPQPEVLHQTR